MPCAFHLDRLAPYSEQDSGCQFDKHQQFFEFDGKSWCRYHLPLNSNEDEVSLKAKWDHREIEQFYHQISDFISGRTYGGIVDLCGVVFPGDFDLKLVCSHSGLPNGITFRRAIFGGNADFDGFSFSGVGDFHAVQFDGEARFAMANFQCIAEFQDAVFRGNSDFGKTTFHQHANFGSARFAENALFTEVKFPKGMDFEEAIFDCEANFQAVHFGG